MPHRLIGFRRRTVVAIGAAALLAGTGGAAALALSGHGIGAGSDDGNSQPIDDNHPSSPPAGGHGAGG